MTDRSRLHELVDTLPESTVRLAQGSLEQFQVWPPPESERIRQMREAHGERMRRAMRPGMGGGGGGGGNYMAGPGRRIEYGHQGFSFWEGDTSVNVTHRFFAGYEFVVEERMRFSADRSKVIYTRTVMGPGGETETHESTYDVEPR